MVHLLDVVIAVAVALEADTEAVEFLDDLEAAFGVFVDRRLIADAVVGDGDLLRILLRRGVAGMTALFSPSMPMLIAPERFTLAFSNRITRAAGLRSLAFSAAIGPAVPPPITSTSQATSEVASRIAS